MLDELVTSCDFCDSRLEPIRHQLGFPELLTPGFPDAWATLVVFFLKSYGKHQLITSKIMNKLSRARKV